MLVCSVIFGNLSFSIIVFLICKIKVFGLDVHWNSCHSPVLMKFYSSAEISYYEAQNTFVLVLIKIKISTRGCEIVFKAEDLRA